MRIKPFLLAVAVAAVCAQEVQWTRFRGVVKGLDLKANRVTIQNGERDLVTIQVTDDVKVQRGKDDVKLGDIRLDDKVVLVHIPTDKPKEPKEETFEEMNRGH
jgi:Cu/Ag efflux protein CusF